jgi:hypothetical protein
MFQSKDGRKYGSAYVAKKKDAMMGPKDTTMPASAKKPSEPKEEPRTDSMGETNKTAYPGVEEVDNTADTKANPEGVDAGAVAAEHGPAEHVHIHHNHSAGKHHVVSHHSDGHMHTSDHASAPDAHAAAAQLGGEANTENNDKSANEDQSGDSHMDMFKDNFPMPRLA